jgi:hypothetical protein
LATLIFLSITVSSWINSEASQRRVLPTTSRGRTVLSRARACWADRYFFAPPGNQLEQQMVQPGDDLGARPAELVAAVQQQAHRHGGVIDDDLPQTRGAQHDHGDAAGVDRVDLAALAGGEHPGSGGQLRRHLDDGLTIGEQPLGDVPADAVATLHRPDPVGVLTAGGEHRLVAVAVGAEPALPDGLLPLVDDLNGGGTLVRIHPDDDASHLRISLLRSDMDVGGRAALLRAGHTPLEPVHAAVTGEAHAK